MNLHSCKELKFKLIPPLLMNQISGEAELFLAELIYLSMKNFLHKFFKAIGTVLNSVEGEIPDLNLLFSNMRCCCFWVNFS